MRVIKLEEIRLLKQSEKSMVLLFREMDGEQLFVQKTLQGRHEIYEMLQSNPHPYLPKIHEVAISDNSTVVLEEYIDGQTLDSAALTEKQICAAIKELCVVLGFLHEKGIIHRDVKPSNIMMASDGHVCLIDFDTARRIKDNVEQDTKLLGTKGYAPPEQFGFSQTDERADIYSLGVTMKQLLGGNAKKWRYRRIIRKCTDLNPSRRYQAVSQVHKAVLFPYRNAICALAAISLLIAVVVMLLQVKPDHIEHADAESLHTQESITSSEQSSIMEAEIDEYDEATKELVLAYWGLTSDISYIDLEVDDAISGEIVHMQMDMTGSGDIVNFSLAYDSENQMIKGNAKFDEGIDSDLWSSLLEELLRGIPKVGTSFLEDSYIMQITCIDMDKDGVKELLVTKGDKETTAVTALWKFEKDETHDSYNLKLIGTVWSVGAMRLYEFEPRKGVTDDFFPLLPNSHFYINHLPVGILSPHTELAEYKSYYEHKYREANGLDVSDIDPFADFPTGAALFEELNVQFGMPPYLDLDA